jgi:cytochrome bd ubiquinol oxidase subunit II
MIVLWLLMLRGIGIELRAHMENPVWRGFFDFVFCASSLLLTIFFGAALGNVVRGVPLAADGYFFEPLWTNFRVGSNNGILDWYTVLAGVIALVTLTAHGSLYVAIKTEGDVNRRARGRVAAATAADHRGIGGDHLHSPRRARQLQAARGRIPDPYRCVRRARRHDLWDRQSPGPAPDVGKEKLAFVASALYIVGMLVGAAFALYPVVLPASTDPARNLTIYNTASGHHGLSVGFTWWILGMVLALGYFFFLFRMFKGKVRLEGRGY